MEEFYIVEGVYDPSILVIFLELLAVVYNVRHQTRNNQDGFDRF